MGKFLNWGSLHDSYSHLKSKIIGEKDREGDSKFHKRSQN